VNKQPLGKIISTILGVMQPSTFLSLFGLLVSTVTGQLSGKVGPSTSLSSKVSKKVCNVLNYGAKADKSTDVGGPIASAFAACKSGGVVVVPSGNYAMSSWVELSGGSGWALQIDGTIYRTGTASGNMFAINSGSDFEMYSSTGKGSIQGNGYIFHAQGKRDGARILRLTKIQNFSVHDIVLVDAPAFHFTMDTCSNGEVYNMAIRGANWGGLDGIDIWSENIWVHDVGYVFSRYFQTALTNSCGRLWLPIETNV
jgi:rhamnogalacturonan hydrolase